MRMRDDDLMQLATLTGPRLLHLHEPTVRSISLFVMATLACVLSSFRLAATNCRLDSSPSHAKLAIRFNGRSSGLITLETRGVRPGFHLTPAAAEFLGIEFRAGVYSPIAAFDQIIGFKLKDRRSLPGLCIGVTVEHPILRGHEWHSPQGTPN
jgi:hypothetical protein